MDGENSTLSELDRHSMTAYRQTLRSRLLWPLLAVSIAASIAVSIGSYLVAARTARRDLADRFETIARTLKSSSFPLTRNVLQSVALLTNTELVTIGDDGSLIETTFIALNTDKIVRIANHARHEIDTGEVSKTKYENRGYLVRAFQRTAMGGRSPAGSWVVVFFDETNYRYLLTRAVIAPLATGLSTIVLLSTITLTLTSRLVNRLFRLHKQVDRIAGGEFETQLITGPQDEVGSLAAAVDLMAKQLQQMWKSLQQQEGERLLHQIAAGLAHNLRNSLTGARLAIELHSQKCRDRHDEGLQVALREMEQTESYVQRLLLVAAGKQDSDKPATLGSCLQDLKPSLETNARHLGVSLQWQCDLTVLDAIVVDGPSLSAALTNLIFNAMQAARQVVIRVDRLNESQLQIDVIDNGPGPSAEICDTLFDAFVTTKSEGLGLGLPLVRRAAKRLGGNVHWRRVDETTIFTLIVNAK